MELVWLTIVALAVFLVAGGAILAAAPLNGKRGSFARLGDLRGKPLSEIIAAVGPYNAIDLRPDGKLVQWIVMNHLGTYHMSLMFNHDDICLGVISERSF